jgi:outer membrane protein OmpA-like peptidoglycan-associated protein
MFDFDSAEPANLSLALSDLADLLPPLDEMSGYVVVVTAYTASDETTEDLARLRAEAVYDMLHSELGLPAEAIRLYSDPVSVDTQRYRQRADIYFLYVGNK